MVWLVSVEQFQVQITSSFIGKCLEKLSRQAEPESTGHILGFLLFGNVFIRERIQAAPDKVRSPAKIDDASDEAFVHGNMGFPRERITRVKSGSIAPDSLLGAQGLQERLAKDQAAVFHRMVRVHR